jgi:hypothetical protein
LTLRDLERSGVRNLPDAVVPGSFNIEISGHQTRSRFDRYAIIISSDDIMAATEPSAVDRANNSKQKQVEVEKQWQQGPVI